MFVARDDGALPHSDAIFSQLRLEDSMPAPRQLEARRAIFAVLSGLAVAILFAATAVITTTQLPASAVAGGKPLINTLGSPGVAIKGYDPVAYFVTGGPRKGKAQFTVQHGGVRWRFASAENKTKFQADPAKYTPVYGGYCAYGVAQGYLVKIEPDAWTIRGGRLYLNYSKGVQRIWEKQPDSYIRKANGRWPRLIARR